MWKGRWRGGGGVGGGAVKGLWRDVEGSGGGGGAKLLQNNVEIERI